MGCLEVVHDNDFSTPNSTSDRGQWWYLGRNLDVEEDIGFANCSVF